MLLPPISVILNLLLYYVHKFYCVYSILKNEIYFTICTAIYIVNTNFKEYLFVEIYYNKLKI